MIFFDTETELFTEGRRAPRLVCLTWCTERHESEEPQIHKWDDPKLHDLVEHWLKVRTLCGQNVVYDLAVLCAQWPDLLPFVFQAYDEGRVYDTKLAQQLHELAIGEFRGKMVMNDDGSWRWLPWNYTLASMVARTLRVHLEKEDTWRLRYGELRDVPLDEWPAEASGYALHDAEITRDLAMFQIQNHEKSPDFENQMRAAWWLHLMSLWGLRTDGARVANLEQSTLADIAEIQGQLQALGLIRKDGSRNIKAAQEYMRKVCLENEKTLAVTEKGNVQLDEDSCERSEDPVMQDYAKLAALKKVLGTDVPILAAGIVRPVHTSFGLAGSGRTTSGNPNIQNFRRDAGIREVFAPREGHVFVDVDYDALELRCIAQVCLDLFQESEMAKVLNDGEDPHSAVAAEILGISYEEAKRRKKDKSDHDFFNARQAGKVANFGFPVGLGPKNFVSFARKTYGVELDIDAARRLKGSWLRRWPEMQKYFAHVNSLPSDDWGYIVVQPRSGRIRARCSYTAACSTLSQGLGADAAKRAGRELAKACYVGPSILLGSRPVAFVHDQFLTEVREDDEMEAKADEICRLMKKGADFFVPDVPTTCEPVIARVWSKDAQWKKGEKPWQLLST